MTAVEPVVHAYAPRGAAADVFTCRDIEVVLSGPAGTGKSRAALEKLNMLALINPGFQGLILRKTRASLGSTALKTWTRFVATEALANGTVKYFGGSDERPAGYYYANGSFVGVGGMDKPDKIMSSEYDVVFVQEAIELTETDWESILTRLRNGRLSFHQLVGDTNPAEPSHWLKQRCDDGRATMLHALHTDNPVYTNPDGTRTEAGHQYIGQILGQLSGVRRDRLLHGLWVAAEGIVWGDFHPATHLIDEHPTHPGVTRRKIPRDWPRIWTIDFGYTNPTTVQWWAIDPDGRAILYRQLYRTRTLIADHVKTIIKTTHRNGQWKEPRPAAIVCDHDAEARGQLQQALGLTTIAANKSVIPGIEAVEDRLRPAGDGIPRILMFRDTLIDRDPELTANAKPACLEEEIPGYIWEPTKDGKPVKEQPVKIDDHGCDAMRYLAAHLDLGATPQIRFF